MYARELVRSRKLDTTTRQLKKFIFTVKVK